MLEEELYILLYLQYSPCYFSIFMNSCKYSSRMRDIWSNIFFHLYFKAKAFDNLLKHCTVSFTIEIIANDCIAILSQVFFYISQYFYHVDMLLMLFNKPASIEKNKNILRLGYCFSWIVSQINLWFFNLGFKSVNFFIWVRESRKVIEVKFFL